mgnify:CR=1 FL=1
MTLIATHAKEAVFEATAFEIRFKFSMDMSRQTFALGFQLLNEGRVVFLYKLVEQSLLWAMAFIGGNINGVLGRNPLAPPRYLTRRCRSIILNHLEIALVSVPSQIFSIHSRAEAHRNLCQLSFSGVPAG